jgi:hypothetical protein
VRLPAALCPGPLVASSFCPNVREINGLALDAPLRRLPVLERALRPLVQVGIDVGGMVSAAIWIQLYVLL